MSGASANSCVIRSPRLCGFHQRDEGDQRSNLSPCLLSASDPEFAYARGFYVWSPDSGVLPISLALTVFRPLSEDDVRGPSNTPAGNYNVNDFKGYLDKSFYTLDVEHALYCQKRAGHPHNLSV